MKVTTRVYMVFEVRVGPYVVKRSVTQVFKNSAAKLDGFRRDQYATAEALKKEGKPLRTVARLLRGRVHQLPPSPPLPIAVQSEMWTPSVGTARRRRVVRP